MRAAARHRRARRHAAIAAVSTAVVLGALAAIILTSSGWPSVRETFFSWPDFRKAFPDVLSGFWLDVKLFCIVEVIVPVVIPWALVGARGCVIVTPDGERRATSRTVAP